MQVQGEEGRAALVIGAGGAIGGAMLEYWSRDESIDGVWAVSRRPVAAGDAGAGIHSHTSDHSEASIDATVEAILRELRDRGLALSRVAVTLGTLHGEGYGPEKSIDALGEDAFGEVFRVNCFLPLRWLSALLPELRRSADTRIAVLSARVGSISDNGLGGWYSYRCSKAALNMGLKSAAIEMARRARGVKLLAYHPGTVDSALSRPFQKNLKDGQLLTPDFTARRLAGLLDASPPDGVLSYRAWDGEDVPW
jgi:NAD(P)-dependent dehydrogenase (short-subunit alcohol dehydrogenase family)